MGFLAPALPYLIGAGASLGSSAIGGALSHASPTSLESQVNNLNLGAMRTGQGLANNLLPQGQNLLSMGTQGYQPVLNYYASLLSGNRGAMTSALAPEISRIGQGYQAAQQTSAALNPRGGPSASFNAELPFQQQRDVSTLLQTARPAAAQGLLGATNATTSAGAGILNQAVNALYGSTLPGQSILQQQQNLRNLEAERGRGIGGGLFSMFQNYGMPALQKRFPSIFGSGDNNEWLSN